MFKKGQSILEVIVALAVFSLISAALITMSTGGFVALEQGGEHTEATSLAEEGIEAVRAIRDRAWNENIFATSSVLNNGLRWDFGGRGTTETIGQYTRTISFTDVCRDGNDNIISCPGNYTDKHTRLATVNISWPIRPGVDNSVERIAYITNWDSVDWVQTDWSSGPGQSVWSNIKKYNTDDELLATSTVAGQLTLLNGELRDTDFSTNSTTLDNDWTFTTAGNYTYDGAKIEVIGGNAQLIEVAGGTTGNTTNSDFNTDSTGWTYNDWDEGGGEVNVTGTHNPTGGNILGWADVNFPAGRGDKLGGYWQQSFTTSVDPTSAEIDFDWQVAQFSGTPTTFKLYVFVDTNSGEPTIGQEVWASSEITSTSGWVSVTDLDVSSKVTTAGTYYVKVAVWIETANNPPNKGPYEIGYDNVYLDWQGPSFPTDDPTIVPTSSYTVPSDGSWSGFTETASKDSGEIYYQLSDDDGTIWYYWNGTIWSPAVQATDYNTASVVNTNIRSFNSAAKKIMFKAFLNSDGTNYVKLDNINITFAESGSPWSFDVWDQDGPSEGTPTGTHQTSGGNSGGYNDITVPAGVNDEVGGYWMQHIRSFRASPTPVTLDFDYKVVDFNGSPDVVEIRVYVDSALGDPVTQVGGAISFSAEGGWVSASQYDLSSVVTAEAVYYVKIAVYVETGTPESGPFTVGFDNVVVSLGNGKHPSSATLTSSSFNMSNNSPVQVIEWDEVLPSATEAVKFEISTAPDSGGSPGAWSSWYGATGAGTFFTHASSTLISTDLNNNQWVRYRATLTGDGTNTPTLTEVRVNYK